MLNTPFHIIFDVVRSAVQVVSFPRYLIRFFLVGIIFLWLIVYHHTCICDYLIYWDVPNIIWNNYKL